MKSNGEPEARSEANVIGRWRDLRPLAVPASLRVIGHCDCRMKNCCPPGLMALVMTAEKLFVPRTVTELVRSGVHWVKGLAMSALPSNGKFPTNPTLAIHWRLVWDERAVLKPGGGKGMICPGVLFR